MLGDSQIVHPDDFYPLLDQYDTVICLNVLEHIRDEDAAIRNMASALQPGGRTIVLVPQFPGLYGSLDEAVGHERRYTRETLRAALERNGLQVDEILEFNRSTLPAWWFNGRLLKRRHFARTQLKIVNWATWLMRRTARSGARSKPSRSGALRSCARPACRTSRAP